MSGRASLLMLTAVVVGALCGADGVATRSAPAAGSASSQLQLERSGAGASDSSNPALNDRLRGLRLINYFPSRDSWTRMWTSWKPTVLSGDFRRIKALHGNAVRLTIFPAVFGYPHPSPRMRDRLRRTIELASSNGLRVQLTLFDGFDRWADRMGSAAWVASLLGDYGDDPRIAFVDLRNEVDPGNSAQIAWVKAVLPALGRAVGNVPVTVSKSDAGTAASLCRLKRKLAPALPDFWDWHYYGVEGLAFSSFEQAMACVRPQPLFIGEVGASTSPAGNRVANVPGSVPAYESYQAYYYRVVAQAASAVGLPPVAPWMLTDLTASGAPPQPSRAELHFGLFRTNGSPKPAAGVVSAYFSGATISDDVNASFEQAVTAYGGPFPAIWRTDLSDQATFRWDAHEGRGGSAAAGISGSRGDDRGAPALWTVPVDAHVESGQRVGASVWARGVAATGSNRLAIAFFDGDGVFCGQDESPLLSSGDTTWTQLTAGGVAPAGAAYVRLYLKSTGNSGTVWFDDVAYEP